MENWKEEMILKALETNPDCCGNCPCIDLHIVSDYGQCNITDEELWNIWEEYGKDCPIREHINPDEYKGEKSKFVWPEMVKKGRIIIQRKMKDN